MTLPSHCLSVPSCTRQRLTYAGYCSEHGPKHAPIPPTRCVAPIRCYCPSCNPSRWMLGPHHSPESIKLMLAAKQAQARQDGRPVLSVVPHPSQ